MLCLIAILCAQGEPQKEQKDIEWTNNIFAKNIEQRAIELGLKDRLEVSLGGMITPAAVSTLSKNLSAELITLRLNGCRINDGNEKPSFKRGPDGKVKDGVNETNKFGIELSEIFKKCVQLQTLYLGGENCDASTTQWANHIPDSLQNLTYLGRYSSIGLIALLEKLPKTMTSVHLDCNCNNESVAAIINFVDTSKNLEQFFLVGDFMSEDACQQLRDHLTSCEIPLFSITTRSH